MRGTCPESRQRLGGLAQQRGRFTRRADSPCRPLRHTYRPLRSPGSGPLRDALELSSSQVLRQILPSGGGRSRHPHLKVAAGPSLHLPLDSSTSATPLEDMSAESRSDLGGSVVAMQTMVLHDQKSVPGPSINTSPVSHHTSSGSHPPSGTKQASLDRMEVERQQLLGLGLLIEVIVMVSRQDSTIQIYRYTGKTFSTWCSARSLDPLTAPAQVILEFLQDGLKTGLCPATLRWQVAALDSIYSLRCPGESMPLSHHLLIQKFLRGAKAFHPIQCHRFLTWHLHTVLWPLMAPPL